MARVSYDRPIDPPSKLLLLAEGERALLEAFSTVSVWPLLRMAPRGDGHAVLVLPGLTAGDESTGLLRRYLKHRHYDVHGWGLGRNLGPRAGIPQAMERLLKRLADQSGRKVSLVGWSLGGVYARRLAVDFPEEVRSVITLGSPFVGDIRASNAWRLYRMLNGQPTAQSRGFQNRAEVTPSMPCTSIYSRSDGVVAWQTSVEKASPHSESIEVVASHTGLGVNPAVLYAVADRLAQPEGAWKPFRRNPMNAWMYPEPATREPQAP